MRSIKPTDDNTMSKILNFASDVNTKFNQTLENSPREVRNNLISSQMSQKMYNFEAEETPYMYNTIGDSRKSMKNLATTTNSVFSKTKFENLMVHKMAYEWKNIYRTLSSVDEAGLGVININEFLAICDKVKVSIIPLEAK